MKRQVTALSNIAAWKFFPSVSKFAIELSPRLNVSILVKHLSIHENFQEENMSPELSLSIWSPVQWIQSDQVLLDKFFDQITLFLVS